MKQVLLHAHIFKNAGTSLDWALRRSFGEGFAENADEQALREAGAAHLAGVLRERPDLRAVSSHHMPAAPPALADCRFHHLYLLRHPLRRALSVYRFERRQQAETRGARAAKEYDLQGYLAWRLRPDVPNVVKNYQVAYLAGCHRPLVSPAEAAEHFAAAQEALQRLPVVGLVERFDESMVLFEQALGPHFPGLDLACRPQNRSPEGEGAGEGGRLSGEGADELSDELPRVLAEMGNMAGPMMAANALDLAIYDLARVRFEAAISAIDDFDNKLREYRKRCSVI